MQIRAGNRQDEPIIRTIIFQSMEELGLESDLDGRDNDLRNIERNYFWYDGLCLVVENDGQTLGVLAGKRDEKDERVLILSRLAVLKAVRRRHYGTALMKSMLFFAANMEYEKIRIEVPGFADGLKFFPEPFLKAFDFKNAELSLQNSPQKIYR